MLEAELDIRGQFIVSLSSVTVCNNNTKNLRCFICVVVVIQF
jgi:hypothetical protein